MKLLVSVRSVSEARLVAAGGADFIDLKEPARGALGDLPLSTVHAIVAALRVSAKHLPISATIGDWDPGARAEILRRVQSLGECGVDYVKVGVTRDPASAGLLEALAQSRWPVIPVFIADRGRDAPLVERAVALGFSGLMVDTAGKRAGSLFDLIALAELRRFIVAARARGAIVGLAGSLRVADVPALLALEPDFAGFRSAVCAGERSGDLDATRLRALVDAVRRAQRLSAQGQLRRAEQQ